MFTVICKTAEAAFNALQILARYWVDVEVQTNEPMPAGEIHLVVTQQEYEHNTERVEEDFQLAQEDFVFGWRRSSDDTCPTCEEHLQVLACGHPVFTEPKQKEVRIKKRNEHLNTAEEARFYNSGAEVYENLTLEEKAEFQRLLDQRYPNGCSWKQTYALLNELG